MMEEQFLRVGFWLGIIFLTYVWFFVEAFFLQCKEKQFNKFMVDRKLHAEFYAWKQTQSRFWRKLD